MPVPAAEGDCGVGRSSRARRRMPSMRRTRRVKVSIVPCAPEDAGSRCGAAARHRAIIPIARRFVGPRPNMACSGRRWRGPNLGLFLEAAACLRSSRSRNLPAAPLKPALGCFHKVSWQPIANQNKNNLLTVNRLKITNKRLAPVLHYMGSGFMTNGAESGGGSGGGAPSGSASERTAIASHGHTIRD